MSKSETEHEEKQEELLKVYVFFQKRLESLQASYPISISFAAASFILHDNEKIEFAKKFGTVKKVKRKQEINIPIEFTSKYEVIRRRAEASYTFFQRLPGFQLNAFVEEIELYIWAPS